MADKRQVKQTIKQLQRVHTWQLVVLLILVGFVAATFLRLNSIGMSERRDAVLAADKAGDDTALEERLYDLQRFSAAHMNTPTGPLYLQGKYNRDYQQAATQASADSSPSGNVSAQADAVCKPQYSSWSLAYVQCFADELAKFPPSSDPAQKITPPPTALYRHEFASPAWSADFAGWTVLAGVVIMLMIVVRLVSLGVLRLLLRQRYKSI